MDAEDYHEQVSGGKTRNLIGLFFIWISSPFILLGKTLVAKSEYEGLFGTAAEVYIQRTESFIRKQNKIT